MNEAKTDHDRLVCLLNREPTFSEMAMYGKWQADVEARGRAAGLEEAAKVCESCVDDLDGENERHAKRIRKLKESAK